MRLAHFAKHLPEPENSDQAAGYALSAIHGVAVLFGAPYYGRGLERLYLRRETQCIDQSVDRFTLISLQTCLSDVSEIKTELTGQN